MGKRVASAKVRKLELITNIQKIRHVPGQLEQTFFKAGSTVWKKLISGKCRKVEKQEYY